MSKLIVRVRCRQFAALACAWLWFLPGCDSKPRSGRADLESIDPESPGTAGTILPESQRGAKLLALRDASRAELQAALVQAVEKSGLEELRLSGEGVDDEILAPVLEIPTLKRLRLEATNVGDATVDRLVESNQLELLYLIDARQLTGMGVKRLGELTRLRNLRVSGLAVDNLSANSLTNLQRLAALALQETAVTDAGVSAIAGLNQLKELSLFRSPVTDASLSEIGQLPSLQKLRLRGTGVTGERVSALIEMPVVELELAETQFSNRGMASVAAMPRLERLNLWLSDVDDDGVEALRGKTQLTSLNLDHLPGVTDRSLDVIATLENLEFLHLGKTGVTESGLPKLYGLKKLKTLHITQLGVSERGVAELRAALPSLERLVD